MIETHVNSIEETVIVLRQTIARLAELDIVDVINADSIRGAELTRPINGVLTPYSAKDDVIVFELREYPGVDLSMQRDDESMLDISSHQLRLVVYGDNSRTVSRKLKSRMLSQRTLNELSAKGISIMNISNIESSTEIINTVRYLRRDLQIIFVVSMKVDAIDKYDVLETASINISNTRIAHLG